MESAISKYYATEALVEAVSAADAIAGPGAHVVPNDLEKKQRDARIMTIYEGTNQVQRFAIIRELVDDVLPRWSEHPEPAGSGASASTGAGARIAAAKR